MRERDTERTKKLLEVSRQRFKRLERIAQQKQSRIQEHLKHREEEHHIRETKMSAIGRRQEEREARLEAELAEKERVVEERREKATRTRIERAGQTDKQRKEVCQRGMKNLDVDRLQHELAGKLELREKRVARFRAEQMDVLRDRMKTYDEKNEKKEQKLQLKSDNMIRGIQVNEKRRVEAEKRVTRNLAKMQQSHEVCFLTTQCEMVHVSFPPFFYTCLFYNNCITNESNNRKKFVTATCVVSRCKKLLARSGRRRKMVYCTSPPPSARSLQRDRAPFHYLCSDHIFLVTKLEADKTVISLNGVLKPATHQIPPQKSKSAF